MTESIPGADVARPKLIYALQIGRGLAAMLVVFTHTTWTLSERHVALLKEQGSIGVDIFFVISGFVIYLTGRKLSWRSFAMRRIARIVPLYWLFLTAKLVTIILVGNDAIPSAGSPGFLLSSYFFIPAYRISFNGVYPLIKAGWTLNYEMYFYAVTVVVILLLPRRWLPAGLTGYMLAAVTIGLLFGGVSSRNFPPIVLLYPICLEFVAGVWIAVLWVRGLQQPSWLSFALLLVAIVAALSVPTSQPYSPWRMLRWGLPAALFVFALINLEPFVAFKRWKLALLLGDASFSIYLSHTAVLPIIDHVVQRLPANAWLQGGVLFVASVLTGVIVYLWIERPLLRLVSRWMKLRVQSPAPQSLISA